MRIFNRFLISEVIEFEIIQQGWIRVMIMSRGKFEAEFNKSKFAGLLFPIICLCLFSQKALSQEPIFPLYSKNSVIWSSNDIPVCWENPSSNFTNEMR
jgi:hypothetical protein